MNGAAKLLNEAADKFSKMPTHIEVTVKQQVEHVHNGAEALSKMMPEFQKQMEAMAKATVNKELNRHMPDAGPFTT